MAETIGTPEGMVSPEDLSLKPSTSSKPAETYVKHERVETPSQTHDEQSEEPGFPSPQSRSEDGSRSSGGVEGTPVKIEPKEERQDVKLEGEFEEETKNNRSDGNPLVGKLKVKPMASLVETGPPNPQPALHPFFAGFDDHIRSLIMNQQFALNSPLIQRPPQFMYYDNSTNMNLKKMLNGHKMSHAPARPAYRPYIPINVPRPPRFQAFRNSFSTQTPPAGGFADATPSTSYRPPQIRPPVRNFNPQNLTAQNLKNISVPSFTPTMSPTPNPLPSNMTTPGLMAFPNQIPAITHNVAPKQTVSTSSSTDDLEKHSGNNVTIKTEVDLGIDSKDDLQTLKECTEFEPHFMDASQYKTNNTPKFEVPDTKPQISMITDDTVRPVNELFKREYELPAYSTKGLLLCKCCDFRCNRKKKMKEHFDAMHTAENRFKCFYCIKKFVPIPYHKTVHDLEHHVGKVHRGEKRWQCKYCTKTYKCQKTYKSHVEKFCSQSLPYACHMCTFTCATESALQKHIKSHERTQETQECPFCNKTFKKFYMKQHLITVHAPPEEKPFKCMKCDFAGGTAALLDSHYKRSGHDKNLKCDECGHTCRSPSIMKHHKLTHKKARVMLVCGVDGCDVRCLHEKSLEAHRQTHKLPDCKVFSCPDKDCKRQFATDQALRFHTGKTLHHKPFKCPDCTLRFLKEESLNKHLATFHVDKILKKMEQTPPQPPVHVKNVVDVYNYVESGGLSDSFGSQHNEEDSVANFGCWLGISGFGDITNKVDCDNDGPSGLDDSEPKNENEIRKTHEDGDEDYQNLVPITCLVELKQEESEEINTFGKNTEGETLVQKEEEDSGDSEYQHVNPEISCLVECQQNATMDSSISCSENEQTETVCLPVNLVKVEVEERNAS